MALNLNKREGECGVMRLTWLVPLPYMLSCDPASLWFCLMGSALLRLADPWPAHVVKKRCGSSCCQCALGVIE